MPKYSWDHEDGWIEIAPGLMEKKSMTEPTAPAPEVTADPQIDLPPLPAIGSKQGLGEWAQAYAREAVLHDRSVWPRVVEVTHLQAQSEPQTTQQSISEPVAQTTEPKAQVELIEESANEFPMEFRQRVRDAMMNAWVGGYNECLDEESSHHERVSPEEEAAVEAALAHPPTSEWNEGVVMQHAITQLEIALATVENNAPINEAEGKVEQAQYERECADSYRAAIAVLKR